MINKIGKSDVLNIKSVVNHARSSGAPAAQATPAPSHTSRADESRFQAALLRSRITTIPTARTAVATAPADAEQEAAELIERHGGRDDFDHEAAGKELAGIARTDPVRAQAIMNPLLGMLEDGDRDEIAQDVVESLTVEELTELAQEPDGQALLEQSRGELDAGRTTSDEHQTIRKIDLALRSAEFGGDRGADVDQAATDVLNVYGDGRQHPEDASAALSAEIKRLEEGHGPGAGADLMQELYERDPVRFYGLMEDSGNPDRGVSGSGRERIAGRLGDFYEGLSPEEQSTFRQGMADFANVDDETGLHLARMVAISGSSELKTEFATALIEEINSSSFYLGPGREDSLLAAAGLAVSNDPAAAAALVDYLKTNGVGAFPPGDESTGRFLEALAAVSDPSGDAAVLAGFLNIVNGANGQEGLSREDVGNILRLVVERDLTEATGVKEEVASLLTDSDPETAAAYLEAIGPEGVLELEGEWQDDAEAAGALRGALARASQAGELSGELMRGLVAEADFAALERLTADSSAAMSDDLLVLIGQRVQSEGISYEMVGKSTGFPVMVRFADDHADAILGHIADSSPTAANRLVQDPSFVRFTLELSNVVSDGQQSDGIRAILKAATDPSLPQRSVDRALMAMGDVLGRPDSFAYDYPGNDQETIVSPEIALTLAEIYRDHGLAFANAAGTSSDESFIFDVGDARNFLHVLLQHQDNEEITNLVRTTVEHQIAHQLALATAPGATPAEVDNSSLIIGNLLAAYGDERANNILDEAKRADAAAQFRNDLLSGAIEALPAFSALKAAGAGLAALGAEEFSVLVNEALQTDNVSAAELELNEQQMRDETALKLGVIQAFYDSAAAAGGRDAPGALGEFYRAVVIYDEALKATGHPGILVEGELNVGALDSNDPADQERIAALLGLTNPASASAGADAAATVFRVIQPLIESIQANREAYQEDY